MRSEHTFARTGGVERLLALEVPDWPVVAAGRPPQQAAAVVAANQVVAVTAAGRAEGVREGLRRREAQRRCPELTVVAADVGRDARAWEAAVGAAEAFTPKVEVTGPGRLALATRGPSRYFGGDRRLGQRLAAAVEAVLGLGGGACRVGVADGRFAATLAAAPPSLAGGGDDPVRVVPPGTSAAFLQPLPVATLRRPELADLLVRLGLRTLGDLAALPPATVLARFGPDGQEAWRLARGLDRTPLAVRTPPPDLTVAAELDPPADRVDTAAFVGKALADELHARLAEAALVCSLVAVEAETDHGDSLVRRWRHEDPTGHHHGALDAGAIADRVRWQLDGWLAGGAATPLPAARASGGICVLRLTAEEVHPDQGRQLGLWGGSAAADDRVARSLARLQGLLGPEAVVTAVLVGGRDPAAQVRLVPWGDPRPAGDRRPPPWPGSLPGPSPALVHRPPRRADVRDTDGKPVTVTGRGSVSGLPGGLSIAGGPWLPVTAWAGPWPVEERWWDDRGRRCARFQLVLAGGDAHLVVRERGRWWVEATYD